MSLKEATETLAWQALNEGMLERKVFEVKISGQVNGGMVVSFESHEPKYSYAEVDENMIVKRTAEKEVISSHALCGAYFFSSAKGFLNAAKRLINEPVFNKPEYYVSLLYNYLLADGETVRLATMEEYYSYGTPEELKQHL